MPGSAVLCKLGKKISNTEIEKTGKVCLTKHTATAPFIKIDLYKFDMFQSTTNHTHMFWNFQKILKYGDFVAWTIFVELYHFSKIRYMLSLFPLYIRNPSSLYFHSPHSQFSRYWLEIWCAPRKLFKDARSAISVRKVDSFSRGEVFRVDYSAAILCVNSDNERDYAVPCIQFLTHNYSIFQLIRL